MSVEARVNDRPMRAMTIAVTIYEIALVPLSCIFNLKIVVWAFGLRVFPVKYIYMNERHLRLLTVVACACTVCGNQKASERVLKVK